MSLSSFSFDVWVENENSYQSLDMIDDDIFKGKKTNVVKPLSYINVDKPRDTKDRRRLRVMLREKLKDELAEELNRNAKTLNQIDRANTQFKMKVSNTLRKAAEKDRKVRQKLEQVSRNRVAAKLQRLKSKCMAIAQSKQRKKILDEKQRIKNEMTRMNNIENRMKVYEKEWKKMAEMKDYYRVKIRRDMEEESRARRVSLFGETI